MRSGEVESGIWRAAASIALVAVGALVGGCGDDDAASESPGDEVTRAAFVKRANAACEGARAQLEREIADHIDNQRYDPDRAPRSEQYEELVDLVLLPAIEREVDGLYFIRFPKREEDRVAEILFAEKSALDAIANTDTIPSIRFVEKQFESSARQLEAFGLTSCTNGVGDREEWKVAATWRP